jgi:hypothetical protein
LLLAPVLHATPTLKPGYWRYRIHYRLMGQNTIKTLEHCFKAPHPLEPTVPKMCTTPVVRFKGNVARWAVVCTLDHGAVRLRSQGTATILKGGDALRETVVSRARMPLGHTEVTTMRMSGVRLVATCPKGR